MRSLIKVKLPLLKEELQVLRLKVKEVVEENRLLHEELKHSVVQEILSQGIDVPGVSSAVNFVVITSYLQHIDEM